MREFVEKADVIAIPIPGADGYVMRSKKNPGCELKVFGAGPADVIFTQVGLGSVNITRLEQAIASGKVPFERQAMMFTLEGINTFVENRDIDVERLREILADPKLYDKPVLISEDANGQHCLLDGNHRVAAHLTRGKLEVKAYVIPEASVRQYLVQVWINGKLYVETEEDLRASFGIHHDLEGNRRS